MQPWIIEKIVKNKNIEKEDSKRPSLYIEKEHEYVERKKEDKENKSTVVIIPLYEGE